MIKRLADWLEKASVGGLWIGIFQKEPIALGLSAVAFIWAMLLTWILEEKEKMT